MEIIYSSYNSVRGNIIQLIESLEFQYQINSNEKKIVFFSNFYCNRHLKKYPKIRLFFLNIIRESLSNKILCIFRGKKKQKFYSDNLPCRISHSRKLFSNGQFSFFSPITNPRHI